MFTNRLFLKVMPASRALVIGLKVILAIAAATSFVWIQTDQFIAPRVCDCSTGFGKCSFADVPSRSKIKGDQNVYQSFVQV